MTRDSENAKRLMEALNRIAGPQPPSFKISDKFNDELAAYGEIVSRDEFVAEVKAKLGRS